MLFRIPAPANRSGNGWRSRNIMGCPRRLLDWSNSPYVALHFVTADLDKYEVDGAIWCVDLMKIRDQVPEALKRMLQEEFAIMFNVDMLGRLAGSLEKFDKLSKEPFVLFLDPPATGRTNHQPVRIVFDDVQPKRLRMDDWLLRSRLFLSHNHPGGTQMGRCVISWIRLI